MQKFEHQQCFEYLSPGVSALLSAQDDGECSALQKNIYYNGFIDWGSIESSVSQGSQQQIQEFEMDKEYGDSDLCKIRECFQEVSVVLKILGKQRSLYYRNSERENGKTNSEFFVSSCYLKREYQVDIHKIASHLESLENIKMTTNQGEEAKSIELMETILYGAMCALIALIERIIIDYILTESPHCNVPRILKDLLKFPETKKFLLPIQIVVLQCLVGPPVGMNLRNILWHGFWFPPASDVSYPVDLFVWIVISVLQWLSMLLVTSKAPTKINSLIDCFCHCNSGFEIMDNTLGKMIYNYPQEQLKTIVQDIKRIITKSAWNIPSRAPVIDLLFTIFTQKYMDGDDMSENVIGIPTIKYQLCLLLPNIEMNLRRCFVAMNDLPTELLFAHSSVFYTTVDMFIGGEYIQDNKWNPQSDLASSSDSFSNQIVSHLGEVYSTLFSDLFLQPAGPRIRDKVAHFEWKPESISPVFIDVLLTLWIWISLNLCEDRKGVLESVSKDSREILLNIEKSVFSYSSKFHPSTMLQMEIRNTVCLINSLQSKVKEDYVRKRSPKPTTGEMEFFDCLHSNPPDLLVTKKSIMRGSDIENRLQEHINSQFGFPSEFSLQESESLSSALIPSSLFYPVKVYNCNKHQLSRITALSQIEIEIRKFQGEIQKKWKFYSIRILSELATSRQIKSFKNISRYINSYTIMSKITLLLVEENLRQIGINSRLAHVLQPELESVGICGPLSCTEKSMKRVPQKWITKLLTSIQKANCKLASHSWDEIMTSFLLHIFPDLVDRFNKN